jgi:6-phosphogluconolactonase (cycloisomerase 2 family)
MSESRRWVGSVVAVVLAACGRADGGASIGAEHAGASASPGAVFVLTNEAAGNAVLAFDRGPGGALAPAGRHETGGAGTGAGLGSQGALALSADGRWLYAVDAGSDELTLFRVRGAALEWIARVPTGGDTPVSVTAHGDLAFVVHAGGAGGIAGFERRGGELRPIAGSARPLGGAAPAQISFDPKGDFLVVTEKATNSFSLYRVEDEGRAEGPTTFPSAGETPFGFAFGSDDLLVVSEAFGGRPGESALSSYRLDGERILPVDPVVRDGQTAACWVVIPRRGRHAYTTNTGSDNVSIYAVHRDGGLAPAAPPAPTGAGSAPTDAAITRDGRSLYVLDSGLGAISAFRVAPDGSLEGSAGAGGLPPSTVGIVAR